jgi:hypothetical protein
MYVLFALVQVVAGAASRASNGLSIETAIVRVSILCFTIVIQRPIAHGSVDPVVGQAQDNRIARTTIRAIDIGVPVTPVRWIQQFLQAPAADGKIWGNADGGPVAALALANGEFTQATRRGALYLDFLNAGGWRRL